MEVTLISLTARRLFVWGARNRARGPGGEDMFDFGL